LTKASPGRQEFHLTVETAAAAVTLLADASQLTKTAVKQAMQKGAVWWQQGNQIRRLRRASRTVNPGDQLHFYFDPAVLAVTTQAATLVADEGSYSVWNKPAGMLSQGSKWGDHCTLTRFAEQHLSPQRTAYLVHRLDRAANGLMVIAHAKNSARELSRQFRDREVTKIYRARVLGKFPEQAEPLVLTSDIDGRSARSEISWLGYDRDSNSTDVQVEITTGRKHQIRRHLAEAGWPVIGDRLYGSSPVGHEKFLTEPLALSACQLHFRAPEDGTLKQYHLPEQPDTPLSSVQKKALPE
jgi:tRNA pseudouridine32 synthase/23S rRNA pseudouridine746 synthase